MGLLSFLFGGKREGAKPPVKRDPGADMIRVATPPKPEKAKPQAAAKPAKATATKEAPAAAGVALKAAPAIAAMTKSDGVKADGAQMGAEQVRLRLRLASAKRVGDLEAAYEAARGLEDIQRLAGRRVGARMWREQAERIYAEL